MAEAVAVAVAVGAETTTAPTGTCNGDNHHLLQHPAAIESVEAKNRRRRLLQIAMQGFD